MKNIILGSLAAIAVAAPLALSAAPANADVPRQCETVVTSTVTTTTATFTAIQPANEYHQWLNLWTHDFTVTVNPDGSFAGTGVQNGHDVQTTLTNEPVTITGTFTDGPDADTVADHVSYTETRPMDNATFTLTDAPLDGTSITNAVIRVNGTVVQTPDAVEFKVSEPVLKTVNVDGTTAFANHGEYVAAMGGGKAAAQSCVGMPVKSNKVK